jgi:hypothetical protein
MHRTSFRLWLLGSVAAFAALGQAINGSFSGIVTDKSGSTIPEAKITVTDLDRNTTFTSVSNETGFYVVSPLPIGRYRIAAEKTGFRQYVIEGLPLSAEQKASVNIVLDVGAVTSEVKRKAWAMSSLRMDFQDLKAASTVATLATTSVRAQVVE